MDHSEIHPYMPYPPFILLRPAPRSPGHPGRGSDPRASPDDGWWTSRDRRSARRRRRRFWSFLRSWDQLPHVLSVEDLSRSIYKAHLKIGLSKFCESKIKMKWKLHFHAILGYKLCINPIAAQVGWLSSGGLRPNSCPRKIHQFSRSKGGKGQDFRCFPQRLIPTSPSLQETYRRAAAAISSRHSGNFLRAFPQEICHRGMVKITQLDGLLSNYYT